MALQDLMDLSLDKNQKKIGISPERIDAIKPQLREYISFWREYPDLFIDFMQTGGDPEKEKDLTFRLFFYQRVFLRAAMRFKYVYAVYPRAYSKSFLSVLILMIRAILYPRAKLFSTAGGKEQAAQILQEKVDDICQKIPAFQREIDWTRGETKVGKDSCIYKFKNGSTIENLAATERSRGRRFHGGLIEECVGVDQKILQEVIIPTMNVSRRCMDGNVREEEVLNQSQIFITTAGYKSTYSYEKLIQLLVRMTTRGDSLVMGGTWRIPVVMGLQPKNFVNDLRNDSTFNEASFGREYESKWTGTVEDAFFDGERFDRCRKLVQPELEASGRSSKLAYYIIAVDVARSTKGCQTIACIFKVTPQAEGRAIKSLVNIYDIKAEHFEDQAIHVKKLYFKYKPRRIVIDGNGLGSGLVDFMTVPNILADGDVLPDFGVINDDEGQFKKKRTKDCELDAIYIIKANAPINTEAHTIAQTEIQSGKVKFLIDERTAQEKLLGTKIGQGMTPEQRAEYLKPFTLTSILKEEMLNLREENEGVNIILKRANTRIGKDKFSAFEYGLYYIKQEEDSKRKKKRFKASDFMFRN